MSFIEKLNDLEKQQLYVFIRHLFDSGKRRDLCLFMKKSESSGIKILLDIFSNKWLSDQYSKLEDIDDKQFTTLEVELNEEVKQFITSYDQLDKITKLNSLKFREILKANHEKCSTFSDQTKRVETPPIIKDQFETVVTITLPPPDKDIVRKRHIFDCILERESRRKFSNEKLSLMELSYLLWSTQGVRKVLSGGKTTLRTIPSSGARNPFETYLHIDKVEGVKPGLYYYNFLDHKLLLILSDPNIKHKLLDANFNQGYAAENCVTFIWSAIPYRTEWRYTTESKKIIAQESGHLCQNLYLAAESIECGCCAIGAYSQDKMDSLLNLDGNNEFVVYIAAVGKV